MDKDTPKKVVNINQLIEMGLSPQRHELHPTAIRSKGTQKQNIPILTKEIVIRHLAKEPGVFYQIQKEKDERLMEKSKAKQQRVCTKKKRNYFLKHNEIAFSIFG